MAAAMSKSPPLSPYQDYTNARIKCYPSKAVLQVANCPLFPVAKEGNATACDSPPNSPDTPAPSTDPPDPPDREPTPRAPAKDPVRSKDESKWRARASVTDIALLNQFSYFFTWTLNGDLIDRYDAEQVSRKVQTFLCNATQRKGFQYVLVPEYHKQKKGEDRPAIHMHGLCNLGAVQIERALSKNGRKRSNKQGRPIYNMTDWKWGFSTCVPLDENYDRTVNYVTKYITKAENKIFGKWYLCSRGLIKKPEIITLEPIPFREFRDEEKLKMHQQFENEIFGGVKIISEQNPPLEPINT